jgi:HNH endonuclease
VRVGVDRRTIAERKGAPPLEPGIYALCEVESGAFAAAGASDQFWAPGEARETGWPTVKLRYVKTYLGAPLTIERLRTEAPDISHLLLDGFQAASFPISADDFNKVISLLGDDLTELVTSDDRADTRGDQLADFERRYLRASPEVKERLGRHIERGPIGALVKKRTGFRCQLCKALGRNPVGFLKENGEPYVEAHHVMPVSTKEVGTLSASNVMTLCANHHRQMHFGGIDVIIATDAFDFVIDEQRVSIPRLSIAPVSALAAEKVLV